MPYIDPDFSLQATTNGAYISTATQTWPASRLISTKVYSKSLSHVYESSHNPKSNQNLNLNPTPTYHPPYKRGFASAEHIKSVQFYCPYTSHLNYIARLFKFCTTSLYCNHALQPNYRLTRGECESHAGTLRACTQWRSANDACSSTASSAYPPRNGLTRIQSLTPPNSHCPNTGRLLVAHHGSRTHSHHVPFPCYHPSLV